MIAEFAADARFRAMLQAADTRAEPYTDHERDLIDRQRRNPGVLIPELADMQLARQLARQQAEQAAHDARVTIRVEDVTDPGSIGSMAIRARQSRHANRRAVNAIKSILRPDPGQSWHDSAEAEMIDAPWSRGRW